MFHRCFLLSIILLAGIFSECVRADPPSPEEQAKGLATPYKWRHLGIAVVGLSSNDKPMLRRISLGVVIPRLSVEVAQQQRECVDEAFDGLGAILTTKLDGIALQDEKYETKGIDADDSEAVELHLSTWAQKKQINISNYINEISAAIEEATISFRSTFAKNKGCAAFEKTAVLILLQRVCPLDAKDNCGFDSKNFTQEKKKQNSVFLMRLYRVDSINSSSGVMRLQHQRPDLIRDQGCYCPTTLLQSAQVKA